MTRNNYRNYYKENNEKENNNNQQINFDFADSKIISLDEALNNLSKENENDKNNEEYIEKGTVVNCYKLNLREKPNKRSNVLDILDKGSEVLVLEDKQNSNFYKVKVGEVIGYCMKEFIEFK